MELDVIVETTTPLKCTNVNGLVYVWIVTVRIVRDLRDFKSSLYSGKEGVTGRRANWLWIHKHKYFTLSRRSLIYCDGSIMYVDPIANSVRKFTLHNQRCALILFLMIICLGVGPYLQYVIMAFRVLSFHRTMFQQILCWSFGESYLNF